MFQFIKSNVGVLVKTISIGIFCSSIGYAEGTLPPATIQKIFGAVKTKVLAGAGGSESLRAEGEGLNKGDTVETGAETVAITLPNGNEIYLAPQTSIKFSDFNDPINPRPASKGLRVVEEREETSAQSPRDYFELKSGTIWLLTATGFDLGHPAIVQTPDLIAGVARGNLVVDYAASNKGLSIAVLEGTVKVGKRLSDVDRNKKVQFVSSGLRVHGEGLQLFKPKKFKRSVISSFVHMRSPDIASEMSRRGPRILHGMTAKFRNQMLPKADVLNDESDEELSWNALPPEPQNTPKEAEMAKTLTTVAEAAAAAIAALPAKTDAIAPAHTDSHAEGNSSIPAVTVGTSAGPAIIPPGVTKNSL